MMNEEAIEMVESAFDAWEYNYDTGEDWSKEHEAKDMAIKALKQQPCEDAVSRRAVQTRLKEIINEMETIFADIREREVDDSVCGLCEYDCDHGLDGFANECPGFEKDDCFKLNEKYRVEWLDISNLPSVTPQYTDAEIQKMQEMEQAEIQKAYELGKAEQPKRGQWIESKGCDDIDHFYVCSECGRYIKLNCGAKLTDYPYCHCGAKMEVENG